MNLEYRTGTEEFELHDGSNSVSDIQDHFKYLLKNGIVTANPRIMICISKMENKITLKVKTGYYLEVLTTWNNESFLEALIVR